MAFNLEDYETVEERLAKFWADCPDGRIETELVNRPNAQANEFVFVARLYRTEVDQHPVSTGWAAEFKTESGFGKFGCELAESSAIGRALANWTYSKKGARPSREEMSRVQQTPERAKPVSDATSGAWSIGELVKEIGAEIVHEEFNCRHGAMVNKVGTAKTGKPFNGYVCIEKKKDSQCPPIWGSLGNNGQWVFRKQNPNDYL